jgi:hypothetical protein
MDRYEKLGWVWDDPGTWQIESTFEGFESYHHRHEGEARSVVTIVDRATDYEPFPDADDIEWWAGVLIPIHAARVVLAQSLPGEIERIGEQINLDPYEFMQTDSLDLAAANAKMIIAAARENA